MSDLDREVLLARIRILNAKLDLAIRQRDVFMNGYHAVSKIPHTERKEILNDCDNELEKLNEKGSE